jgi:two-component system OmpR family sensor kinase
VTRQRILFPRSIRGRLVAVLLACLAVSGLIVAAVTTIALRRFLFQRLDQQLIQAGNRYATSLEQVDNDSDNRDIDFAVVAGQSTGTLGARVVAGKLTSMAVVGANDSDAAAVAAARDAVARLRITTKPHTVRLPGIGDYRVMVQAGDDNDLLVTGLPEHPVDETLARLLAVEAIVFATAIVISGAAAATSVRLSLRPLTRVTSAAYAVAELPLASGEVEMPAPVANPEPETEAGHVATAFNHMVEHIDEALSVRQASEERLRRFVADASHELRTPVAVIRSHAEFAQRFPGAQEPEVARALSRITAESDRMGRFVDDLLTLARLDAGRPLAKEPVDVTRLILDAVEDARVAGPTHRWRLEFAGDTVEPVEVLGDGHALHQLLANLLANARAHTPPGTTVTVTLDEPSGSTVAVTVHDDGPGIPAEIQSTVFERFVHGTPARDDSGGTGLGLSIVAAIAKAHGGRVVLTSEPGSTSFRITLPIGPLPGAS